MKKLFLKPISATLLLGLILPSLVVFKPKVVEAQFSHPAGRPTGSLMVPVTLADPATPPSPLRPPNAFSPSANRPYQQQTAGQALSQVRADDSRQCLEESRGGGGSGGGGGAGLSSLLPPVIPIDKAVSDATTLVATPNAIEQVFTEVNESIQQEFRTAFNQNIITGLKDKFPAILRRNLLASSTIDFQNDANIGQFRDLINRSIRESLPEVFNEDLFNRSVSSAVSNGLQNTVGDALTVNLREIARPIVETQYAAHIEGIVSAIPDLLKERFDAIKSSLEGAKAALEGVKTFITSCAANLLTCLFTFPGQLEQIGRALTEVGNQIAITADILDWIEKLDPEQLKKDMLDSLTLELETSITDPSNIARLGDQIIEAMEGPLNQSMSEAFKNISNSFTGPTGPIAAVEEAIDKMDDLFLDPIIRETDLRLNAVVGEINRATDSVIDGFSAGLTTFVDREFGKELLYPLALDIRAGATGAGEWVANGLNGVGSDVSNFFYPPMQVELVPDASFIAQNRPLLPNQMLESDYNRALANEGFVEIMPNGTVTGGTPPVAGALPQVTLDTYQNNLATIDRLDAESGITPPLANATGDLAEKTGEQVTGAVPGVVGTAFSNQTGVNNSVTGLPFHNAALDTINSVVGGATSLLVDLTKTGIPIVDVVTGKLLQAATVALTKAVVNAAVGASGTAAALVTVPVTEVGGLMIPTLSIDVNTGQILATSNAIKGMTEKILQLQVESCTHLKVIQRVQLAMEAKELYGDREARKAAAEVTKQQLIDKTKFSNEGRDKGNGEMGSFYNSNPNARLAEQDEAVKEVLLIDINLNKADILQADQTIEALNIERGFVDSIKRDLTDEEFDNFVNGANPGGETPAPPAPTWNWDTWNKIIKPQNNPVGSFVLIQSELARRQAVAERNLREEILAGQGYEGVKVGGKIVTPGILLKEELAALVTSIIRQMENVQEQGADINKQDSAVQGESLENLTEEASWPPYNCPAPGPCPAAPAH